MPVIQTGIIIEKGSLLPAAFLKAAAVAGIRVMHVELIITKRTVSLSAEVLSLIAFILLIASIPKGVAPFPSPSRFAVILAHMKAPASVL